MFWPFGSKKKDEARKREASQRAKVHSSQMNLIDAATQTANVAQVVTNRLKAHLDDSIRQFDTTARIMTDALIICDLKGQIKAFNPAAEKVFGYSGSAIENNVVANLFRLNGNPPATHSALWASLDSLNDKGSIQRQAITGCHLDGAQFEIRATLTYLDRFDGSKLVMILVHDLTVAQALERAMNEQLQVYDSLLDISSEGIMIVQDGKVVAANPAAEILFGHTANSLLHQSVASLLTCEPDSLTADERVMKASALREDGTSLPLVVSSAKITWSDRPAVLVTVKDSNAVRELDIAIRARQNTGVDMVCNFTPDFCVVHANPTFCEYYGVNPADIIGKSLMSILPEENIDAFMLTIQSLTVQQPMRRKQVLLPGRNGPHLQDWVDYAFFDSEGHVIEYQRTGRDMTDILAHIRSIQEDRTP